MNANTRSLPAHGLGFHGSYRADDVRFLLQPLDMKPVADVREKERLIQSGAKHYSEMIGLEKLPSPAYLALFDEALARNGLRMALDVFRLARRIVAARNGAITLVSFARAGTPVGVVLRHVLREHFGCDAAHYSISVIRDRGVDAVALRHVLARHAPESIVFVDGWTGKGSIATELTSSLREFRLSDQIELADELFVLCDIAGVAYAAGSSEDYLIPSAVLNATVSGLVSRSILNADVGDGFHGCLFYEQWQAQDLSIAFIEQLLSLVRAHAESWREQALPDHDRTALGATSASLIANVSLRYQVTSRHFIKPGIGEATRALLRRAPRLLLLRDDADADVQHLRLLAAERGVSVVIEPGLRLKALAIIEELADV